MTDQQQQKGSQQGADAPIFRALMPTFSTG
jgi:hypothetical protein